MPVASPRIFGVLAHELRSPVSVLQGYVRLLRRMPDVGAVDPAVLDGMSAAASTLETLGRDAALLAGWLDGRPVPATLVPLTTLCRLITADLPEAFRLAPVPDALASTLIPTPDARQLTAAIATVCLAVSREGAHPGLEVTVTADGPTQVRVTLASNGRPATKPFSFEAGGLGLGLVLAGAVLERHGADVTDRANGGLEIALPCEQEAA